jgi:hypothetical protein
MWFAPIKEKLDSAVDVAPHILGQDMVHPVPGSIVSERELSGAADFPVEGK